MSGGDSLLPTTPTRPNDLGHDDASTPPPEEQEWLVSWSINVTAGDPVEAALRAWQAMRAPNSSACAFLVDGDVVVGGLVQAAREFVDLHDLICVRCGDRIWAYDDEGGMVDPYINSQRRSCIGGGVHVPKPATVTTPT